MTKTKDSATDLSEAAVARRLEQVRSLYQLMASLRRIDVEQARPASGTVATDILGERIDATRT